MDASHGNVAAAIAAAAAGIVSLAIAIPASAGGEKVAFPEKFASGILYATIDRTDLEQYREFYAPAGSLEAAKKGQPLPDGTVIVMAQYAALLTASGQPQKGPKGGYVKGKRLGYMVMEKRAGWGTYVPQYRNGEWEYQSFMPDGKINHTANILACFTCHKPLGKQDFVFTYDRMKAAAK